MKNLKKHIGKSRFRINLPFVSYEIGFDELINSKNVDERIAKLGELKRDLEAAVEAVENLQSEASERKDEIEHLQQTVNKLEEDKFTAETMLKLPEDSFARLVSRASSRGRVRGIIEGSVIGFVTGALSSLLIWYLTKGL